MTIAFVEPETKRLDLSDGAWIEVKKRLTFGEREQESSAALGNVKGQSGNKDVEVGLDWKSWKVERMLVWLVDWSARDKTGKPIKINRDSLGALDPESGDEIEAAITEHVKALEEEKKARSGKTEPVPV